MSEKGNSTRARLAERVKKVQEYTFGLSTVLITSVIVLVVGIGIGGSTNTWNSSLKLLGLKPDAQELDFSSLQNTYDQLAANFDGNVDAKKAIDGAKHGLVAAMGDPYTLYFNAEESKKFSDNLSGAFSGIGAALAIKDDILTVSSVLEGSPAKAAGVMSGDAIIAVDGNSTQGWSVEKAVTAIRGKAGTTVKITVARGDERPDYTITRADLTNPSVTSEVKDGIGVMTISRFGEDTSKLAEEAAVSFKSQNVKGIVLDLRGNGGGYVDAAQDISSLWLNDKVVVSERVNGATVNTLRSGTTPVLNGIPTIVLIDGGSASASEIVAGALHDNKVASLLGEKSFGKGSVQNVLNLEEGSQLKVTVARWFTPDGKNIDKTGITPDTIVAPTADQIKDGQDPAKEAAFAQLAQ